ncbi:MAG: hypothetical protein R3F29_14100 [Planctomycetota bacterium]
MPTALASLTALLTSATLAPRHTPLPNTSTLQGSIAGWSVEGDGTVLLHLETADGEHRWLRTPPNQSSTTQFELLALHAILDLERDPARTVHVTGESTTENDGSSREKALELQAIGH